VVASLLERGGAIVKITNFPSGVNCAPLPRGCLNSWPDLTLRTTSTPSSACDVSEYANHWPSSERRAPPIDFQDSYMS